MVYSLAPLVKGTEPSAIADGQTPVDRLTPLSGTASDGTWRITTSDRDNANGRLAICAIVKRPPSASLDGSELIGTGFYLVPDGDFATARHAALEALDAMSQGEHSVGLVYSLSDGPLVFRPVWRFCLHPTADLAFGIPHEIYDNRTGKPYRAKVLSLDHKVPAIGARISTWAYPRRIAFTAGFLRRNTGTDLYRAGSGNKNRAAVQPNKHSYSWGRAAVRCLTNGAKCSVWRLAVTMALSISHL